MATVAKIAKNIASYQFTDTDSAVKQLQRITISDSAGNELTDLTIGALKITFASQLAGEDLTIGVMKVEQRFTYSVELDGSTNTVIKSAPGFVHSVLVSGNATGAVTMFLRDSTTTGSGTIIKTYYFVANSNGINVALAVNALTNVGIEADFTGKADSIRITFIYR